MFFLSSCWCWYADVVQVESAALLTLPEILVALPSSSTQRKATGIWSETIRRYSSFVTQYSLVFYDFYPMWHDLKSYLHLFDLQFDLMHHFLPDKKTQTHTHINWLLNRHTNNIVPRTRTKFRERAFSVAGPSIWNSLPEHISVMLPTNAVIIARSRHYFNVHFSTP